MMTKVTHKHIYGQPWTREEVIEAMRQRVRQKLPITLRKVRRDDSVLCGAVLRTLGGWRNIYKILGIKNPRSENMRRWPLRKVIRALRETYLQKDVTPQLLTRRQYLWTVAQRFFPSRAFLRKKFNIPRLKTRSHIWPCERIIKCLQERMRHKKPMNTMALLAENRFLYEAAHHHFGSYKRAINAAGFNYDSIRLKSGRARISVL